MTSTTSPITQVGCFKAGSRVFAGKGKVVWVVKTFHDIGGGKVLASVRTTDGKRPNSFLVSTLILAGPNGEG